MMRRNDRQVNADEELLGIINDGKIIQIAFIDGNEPYIVTMNYGFTADEGKIKFYFHSAVEGRKIDLIAKEPRICFSISICDPFVAGEKACNYGMKYRSVVGYGKIRLLTDEKEKIYGLNCLMEQYTGKSEWDYDAEMMKKTAVIRLDVEEISGKRKK
jgi:uncharacterized protein